ncbi:hypothetical protein ES703_56345 [subsurface metagenome]
MKRKTYIADPAGILQAQLDFLRHCPYWLSPAQRFLQVKYGGGIADARGSMAGNTYSRNRFGNYMRSRTKPINPRSSRQSAARILMMMLAEQWRESPMDDAKRLAWETYAKGVNWNNMLGETVTLTGYNMFIRSNAALLAAGGTLVTDGPPDIGLPPGDEDFAVVFNATTRKVSVTFDPDKDWAKETGAFLSVEIGRPQSATRNFFGTPYRNTGAIAGVDTTGVSSPQLLDPAFTLTPGQKIWARARIIRKDSRCSTHFLAKPVLVTGALYKLEVTGTLVPDMTGEYTAAGTLAEKTYYATSNKTYFIWWNDDDTSWYMTPILGAAGVLGHFTKAADPVTGEYILVLPAEGTPTVADIS